MCSINSGPLDNILSRFGQSECCDSEREILESEGAGNKDGEMSVCVWTLTCQSFCYPRGDWKECLVSPTENH